MATTNSNTEQSTTLSKDRWPQEPEGLLEFVPDDLAGTPYDMLFNILTRAQGVVAVLCAEFMGGDDYRPKAPDIVGALWTAQSQLKLALDLMERLDVVAPDEIQDDLYSRHRA